MLAAHGDVLMPGNGEGTDAGVAPVSEPATRVKDGNGGCGSKGGKERFAGAFHETCQLQQSVCDAGRLDIVQRLLHDVEDDAEENEAA